MKMKFYYNFTCPHCFIAYKNLVQAIHNCGMQNKVTVDFIPTNHRSDDEEIIQQYLKDFNIAKEFIYQRGHDLDIPNKVMQQIDDQHAWYIKVCEAYFYEKKDITNKELIVSLLNDIQKKELEKIFSTEVEYEKEYEPTTMQIGDIVINGIKNVSYYEFALSCFPNEERKTPLKDIQEDCDGCCCG